MIHRDEARELVRGLDTVGLARIAWRAAGVPNEGDAPRDAAVGFDLETSEILVLTCPVDEDPPPLASSVILLATCSAAAREHHTRRLSIGHDAPPDAEAIEEQMVHLAARQSTTPERLEAVLDEVYGAGGEARRS
ncbi:MAG: hypothetical protein M3Q49_00905 [Actinomycetota bacterium]|nr:hypothetical protein [Actinomycetota bacterium]